MNNGTATPDPGDNPESPTRLLLGRHHGGDPDALGALLSRELSSIREQVHRQLGGALRKRMDTGDMVNDICLLVLQKGPRFLVRDPRCFRALMARIIRNRIISAYRSYGPAAEREVSMETPTCLDLDRDRMQSPSTHPPDRAARNEERELVRLALLLLPPLDAEILRLRDDVDLKFAEIARRLDKKEDAVRIRYGRALHKLETCILELQRGQVERILLELERDTDAEIDAEGDRK